MGTKYNIRVEPTETAIALFFKNITERTERLAAGEILEARTNIVTDDMNLLEPDEMVSYWETHPLLPYPQAVSSDPIATFNVTFSDISGNMTTFSRPRIALYDTPKSSVSSIISRSNKPIISSKNSPISAHK